MFKKCHDKKPVPIHYTNIKKYINNFNDLQSLMDKALINTY